MPEYIRIRQELPASPDYEAVEFSAVVGTLKDGDGIKLLPDKPATFSDGRPLPEKYVASLAANVATATPTTTPAAASAGASADLPAETTGREAIPTPKEN